MNKSNTVLICLIFCVLVLCSILIAFGWYKWHNFSSQSVRALNSVFWIKMIQAPTEGIFKAISSTIEEPINSKNNKPCVTREKALEQRHIVKDNTYRMDEVWNADSDRFGASRSRNAIFKPSVIVFGLPFSANMNSEVISGAVSNIRHVQDHFDTPSFVVDTKTQAQIDLRSFGELREFKLVFGNSCGKSGEFKGLFCNAILVLHCSKLPLHRFNNVVVLLNDLISPIYTVSDSFTLFGHLKFLAIHNLDNLSGTESANRENDQRNDGQNAEKYVRTGAGVIENETVNKQGENNQSGSTKKPLETRNVKPFSERIFFGLIGGIAVIWLLILAYTCSHKNTSYRTTKKT
jgi:hypothetical protein